MAESAPSSDRSPNDVAEFYNVFSDRLIRDYIDGNLRHRRAIDLVCRQLNPNTKSVLDVGCGIGVSANQLIETRPDIHVTAVDISPRNIDIAKKLFPDHRITFRVADMMTPPTEERFDQINLIDVYEHIPRDRWPQLHQILSACLDPKGTVVLTTPSAFHQQWLHENHPDGLQVVDETVEMSDVCQIADDLDAEIMHYEMISVWHSNDYVHLVMQRDPPFVSHEAPDDRTPSIIHRISGKLSRTFLGWRKPLEVVQQERRREDVQRALGITVAPHDNLQERDS